jgi:type I restriction enzyme S subunit
MNRSIRSFPEVVEVNPRRFSDEIRDDSLVSFVPMKSVEEETGRLVASETRLWSEVKKGYTPFQEGDVLFAKITPCMENGKYALAAKLHDGRAAGSTEFHVFRPKAELDPKYLLFFLFSPDVRHEAKRNMRGAAGQLRVPSIFFENLQIPLPSLDDQKRIVAEIEKQFTRLDAGVASLMRVQTALKRYRASVLKAACEGCLVPTEAELARKENRTYETGEQLLQRILKERREQWNGKGEYKEPLQAKIVDLLQLPQGWAWATVEQLNPAARPCAYGVLQPGSDVKSGIPIVRVGNINDGKVDQTNLKRIAPNIAARYPRTKLRGGEVAISLVGAIGRTAVIPATLANANTARAVGIIPLTRFVTSHWIEIWFRNPRKIAEMTSKAHEVARKTLNLEDVRSATVALPPLAEQTRIVAEVDRRLSVVEELGLSFRASGQRATRLRQSILGRAFANRE